MRWKSPRIGDSRVLKKFLLFPRKINNEYRWFETVYIEQIYMVINYTIDGMSFQRDDWHDTNWLNKWGH